MVRNNTTIAKASVIKYMDDIESGKILSSRWVKLAVKRHKDDLVNGGERGLYFDDEAAQHIIDFFRLLRHSKGEWAGQQFVLEPWQTFILWVLFGWKRESDGFRRFRVSYTEIARKNGKSTFAAGIGLYLFAADNEPGAEVYTAATKRDQAKIVHDESVNMVKKSPSLKRQIGIMKNNLHFERMGSKYEPLGADADSMDGLNPHGNIIDELHAHKTRACWDVLDTATGSRRQPLMFAITTSGFNQLGICYEQREYAISILEGMEGFEDDTFFAIIYTLDKEDDWKDEKVWIKSNPNLGVSVKPDDLQRKAKKALRSPGSLNNFLCKHMNQWVSQETRWLSLDSWDKCNGLVDESVLMQGVYGGVDLSTTQDIAGYVLSNSDGDGKYHLLPRLFIPEDNARNWNITKKIPYDVWEKQGFIFTTPGNSIDYDFIEAKLLEDIEKYGLIELAFDDWNATQFINGLVKQGIPQDKLVIFRQGFKSMNEPAKEVERLIDCQSLVHGGHPILRWAAANVAVRTDESGNIRPVKPGRKSALKIDPIVMTIMAIGRAMMDNEDQYVESEGVMVV